MTWRGRPGGGVRRRWAIPCRILHKLGAMGGRAQAPRLRSRRTRTGPSRLQPPTPGPFMKAAIFAENGGPEVIHVAELERPEPGPGQVRLDVRASSLNHLDLWVRRGLPVEIPMPHVGGSDMAGVVDAVGAGVDGVRPGTRVVVDPSLDWGWVEGLRRGPGLHEPEFRVMGEHTQGGFAEYAIVPADNLLALPDHVSFQEAAAAGLVGVTAWRAVVGRGQLRAGERVLVTGGSGGVSTMAIQIARHAGAEVWVITSGEDNGARVRELGAHHVIDRTAGDVKGQLRASLGGRGVDLVVDSVGEALWGTLVRALAPGGRLVLYGATTGPKVETDLRHVFWKQLSILGTTMGSPVEFRAAMEAVFRGDVAAPVHRVTDLDGVRGAHEELEAGDVFGKIVVVPPGS
ncbi:MAG: alcohol dehydrogenase [Gemmatimonadales bacterium]|nr:MAG: alcohol dehydrogenase [Gemmatimonadales bacterium]